MQLFSCIFRRTARFGWFGKWGVLYSGVMTLSAANFRPTLQIALEAALNHLENLDETPVAPRADLATLRERLARPLADEGMPAEEVVTNLVRDTDGGHIGCAGGRFFGWAGSSADRCRRHWRPIGSLRRRNETARCSPADRPTAVAEEVAGGWLKEILGLPARVSFPASDRLPDAAYDLSGGGTARVLAARRVGRGRTRTLRRPRPSGFSPAISVTGRSNAVCGCWGWDADAWWICRWTMRGD